MDKNLLKKAKKCSALWVAGYPSYFGGADTELYNIICVLREYGIEVNCVPMFGEDPNMRKEMDSIGVKTYKYEPTIFKDKVVGSRCNGSFLQKLPEIMEKGKPRTTIFSNCMTYLFPLEIKAQSQGWLDFHTYVSNFQRSMIMDQLTEKSGVKVQELVGYKPYFHIRDEFRVERPEETFNIGRLSRNDPAKFAPDMWRMFDRVLSKRHKKVFIQAYSQQVAKKVGTPPPGLDWMTTGPNEIPVKEFYHKLHCILHKTGGSRESYCRIVPECYAHGTVMIAENDFAFPDLIIDGETGFVCDSSDEMSFRASEMANYESERIRIVNNAYDHLKNNLMNKDECVKPWIEVLS